MNRPPALWISGWGHAADSLRPVAGLCGEGASAFVSLAELAGERGGPEAGRLNPPEGPGPVPPVWIGWSAGALLALEAAGRGAILSGLVLLSGTPRFCAASDWPHGVPVSRVRAMRAALRDGRGPAVKAAFQRQCAHPDPVTEEDLRVRVAGMDRQGAAALDGGLEYLMAADARGGLDRLRVPVLVLHGKEDRVIPAAASEWVASRIPGACLRVLEGKGHRFPLDSPDTVAGILRPFLEGLRP